MIRDLTIHQVLFIHARVIAETGGSHEVRDLGLLESAITRPQATFDGEDLYKDLFSKAAALQESLVGKHAFIDGNKRTAVTATGLFLLLNGYRLIASNQDVVRFTLKCAKGITSLDQIRSWLLANSTQN